MELSFRFLETFPETGNSVPLTLLSYEDVTKHPNVIAPRRRGPRTAPAGRPLAAAPPPAARRWRADGAEGRGTLWHS